MRKYSHHTHIPPYPDSTGKVLILTTQLVTLRDDSQKQGQTLPSKAAFHFPLITFLEVFIDFSRGFPGGTVVKNQPDNAGDTGLIPGLERSPREKNGNPLQDSPGESHGQRSLVDYTPCGCKELDIT